MTKPIILDTHSILAILDKNKTQFRRPVKNLCGSSRYDYYAFQDGHTHPYYFRRKDAVWDSFKTLEELAAKYCPFGTVGDLLWVRESFTYWEDDEFGGDYLEYRTGHRRSLDEWEYPHPIYDHCIGKFNKWLSPVAMPRWASRITLKITSVKVERLQDISEQDAIAEGIEQSSSYYRDYSKPEIIPSAWVPNPKYSFETLWQLSDKKHPWDSNPWVWVITFKKVDF